MNMHFGDMTEATLDILRRYRVGVWTIEIETGREPRMYADDTMLDLLGVFGQTLTPEELYLAWYNRVDPRHYDAVTDGVDRMINGMVAEIQYPWIHPTKGIRFVRCGARRDFSCKEYIRLEGTHQDVTHMNHVQKDNGEDVILREKLNMQRRRYMMMTNLIKSAQFSCIYGADGKTTSLLWSDELRHLLGYKDVTDFPNTFEAWHDLLHPDDVARVDAGIKKAVEDRSDKEPYEVTYRLKTRDCGWRWFRARGEVSRLADGKPFEFSGVITDVDAEHRNAQLQEERLSALEEVKRTSLQLEQALAEAQRAERMKSTFLATMSHEIRTPLNAVIGFAEFLRDSGGKDIDRDVYVQGILDSSNALLSLINDILDLSKVQAGMMPFRGGASDLGRLFAEMDTIFRFSATRKGIVLKSILPPGLPQVGLREERLRQILINLIGNAVKFTNEGGVEYSAEVIPDGEGTVTLELVVRDSGIGIAADRFDTIFDPFSQGGSVRGGRVYQGTGLGLSICRRLLETVDGMIEVESEVGKGTSFIVRVPHVAIAKVMSRETLPETGEFELPEGALVYIVDDVPLNLRIMERHLMHLGIERMCIRSFSSARETLASLEQNYPPPALILTDMWMPEMDGGELGAAVRARTEFDGVRLVAETADADTTNTFDMSIFDAVLTKPLTGEKLKQMLARLFPKPR